MELENSRAAIVLLAAVVVASGCGGSGESGVTISQNSGVSIQKFDATPNELFSNQVGNIQIVLKNTGGHDATGVTAKLFGPPFEGDRSWDIEAGSEEISFGDLRAANPENDQPANEIPRSWTLEAPGIQSGVSIPYDFRTRIFYLYETTGTTTISVMSDERFREEGNAREKPTLDNTGGPVQMEVRTRTPIVFFSEGGSSTQESDLCIIVRNSGSGTAFLPGAKSGSTYKVTQDNQDKVEVSVQGSGNRIDIESEDKTVNMVGGKGVACFTMESDAVSSTQIQQDIPVTVTADYGYYVDSSTSIKVNGRDTSGS